MDSVVVLKPCPFCASPGRLIHPMGSWVSREVGYGPNGSRIVCTGDNCSGCGWAFYGPDQDAQAIAQWNTRLASAAADAGGDWVMVPRVPTPEMIGAAAEWDGASDALRRDGVWSAMLTAAPAPAADVERIKAERIETVPLLHPFEDAETPPYWRVEVDGYCADFDHEQAARNFAEAINRHFAPRDPAGGEARS